MWKAKVIKAEDVVFEDRIGQDPPTSRFARIVRQPLSGGLGFGILEVNDIDADWFINYDEIFYVLEGTFRCIIDGEVFEGSAGDTIFFAQGYATALRINRQGEAPLHRQPGGQCALAFASRQRLTELAHRAGRFFPVGHPVGLGR